MDLEMTGLNPETDVIVEIATLVTDDELNIIAEGPNLVIFQPEEAMASMGDFVTQMHTTSGLLELIKTSTISHDDAMQQTLNFIKEQSPEAGKFHYVETPFVLTEVSLRSTCQKLNTGCTTAVLMFQQ